VATCWGRCVWMADGEVDEFVKRLHDYQEDLLAGRTSLHDFTKAVEILYMRKVAQLKKKLRGNRHPRVKPATLVVTRPCEERGAPPPSQPPTPPPRMHACPKCGAQTYCITVPFEAWGTCRSCGYQEVFEAGSEGWLHLLSTVLEPERENVKRYLESLERLTESGGQP